LVFQPTGKEAPEARVRRIATPERYRGFPMIDLNSRRRSGGSEKPTPKTYNNIMIDEGIGTPPIVKEHEDKK